MTEKEKAAFPLECVRHMAAKSCMCQATGPDVHRNRHYVSCMVGKAHDYYGVSVQWMDANRNDLQNDVDAQGRRG